MKNKKCEPILLCIIQWLTSNPGTNLELNAEMIEKYTIYPKYYTLIHMNALYKGTYYNNVDYMSSASRGTRM